MRLPEAICLTHSQFLVHRRAIHPECRSYQWTKRHRGSSAGRDKPSLVKAKEHGRLGSYAPRAVRF